MCRRPGEREHIVKGASKTGSAPVRIQAQVLRDMQPCSGPGEPVLVIAQDEPVPCDNFGARWCQADVERAIAAAKAAQLQSYRVEIGPDGTITIVVGEFSGPAG